jgi:hypothetical protein
MNGEALILHKIAKRIINCALNLGGESPDSKGRWMPDLSVFRALPAFSQEGLDNFYQDCRLFVIAISPDSSKDPCTPLHVRPNPE